MTGLISTSSVVNSTTIDATLTVFGAATRGADLPVTVTNDAANRYGKATGEVLTMTWRIDH